MFSILTLLILILFSFQTSQSSIVSANSFTDGDLEVRGGLSYLTGKKEPFSGIIKTPLYHVTYENGVATKKISHSFWERFNEKGNLWWRTLYNYQDGIEEGLMEEFYDDGKLEFRKYMKEGEIHGMWEQYYENGQLEFKGVYFEAEDKVVLERNWHVLLKKITFYDKAWDLIRKYVGIPKYGNEPYDGYWVNYYEDGQIKSKRYYKDKKRINVWRTFYPNGKIKTEERYVDGFEDGNWYWYSKNGKIEKKERWERGVKKE